jgi:peptidyl-prolyl cis-trans isomerase C
MRVSIPFTLASLLLTGVLPLDGARAQAPAPKAAAPGAPGSQGALPAAAKAEVPPKPENLDQVLATVNGEKITRGDLLNFLGRYQVPQIRPERLYHDAIESLINSRLLGQFLARQQIAVPPEKVNEAIARIESNLKASGRGDLQTLLQQSGGTMDDIRRQVIWDEFVKLRATDAELKKFAANHKDLVNSNLLKASHIYLNVPVDATAADKEKIRQKVLAIKQDIADKKTSFAAAANGFSQDPSNDEKSGGDIGYFGLQTGIIPEFAEAAFALKEGEISEPVETIHGFHLIVVTDRKEGNPVDFDQHKDDIFQLYQADLHKQIVAAERKTAEEKHTIDIQPMPPDLFPPTPPAVPASSPSAAAATAPAPGGNPPAPRASVPDAKP